MRRYWRCAACSPQQLLELLLEDILIGNADLARQCRHQSDPESPCEHGARPRRAQTPTAGLGCAALARRRADRRAVTRGPGREGGKGGGAWVRPRCFSARANIEAIQCAPAQGEHCRGARCTLARTRRAAQDAATSAATLAAFASTCCWRHCDSLVSLLCCWHSCGTRFS